MFTAPHAFIAENMPVDWIRNYAKADLILIQNLNIALFLDMDTQYQSVNLDLHSVIFNLNFAADKNCTKIEIGGVRTHNMT